MDAFFHGRGNTAEAVAGGGGWAVLLRAWIPFTKRGPTGPAHNEKRAGNSTPIFKIGPPEGASFLT